ncbi:hypothetical protein GUA46_03270 [Muricauda sp. HICW]|uniref:NADP-dependent oxidoreductase domain-containing protein n=1 Tax=Flagellimonas chongwuensis TaxID=2697365 RepID=A0A850NEI7_9FLAO|nr:aldo/keto reductase [Allomuricauda chongwuensis]NVN17350.1 hypothetical protein [Allomuricauda chongwuensis]
MKYRKLGKTGIEVSEISLGTWQVGGKWGSGFNDALAEQIINEAIDDGVNFIDTADVYEAGASEAAVGRVVKSRSEEVFVATKCGRQINPHINEGYTPEVLRKYVEDSLKNTGLEAVNELKKVFPDRESLAPIALRWILDFPEVGCIIPGASKVEHLNSNINAAKLPPLTKKEKVAVNDIYEKYIKKHVHQLW